MSEGLHYQHFGNGSVGGLLRARAAACPEHTLLLAGAERFSYSEVAMWAGRIARALMALGCSKGDRVAIFSGNSAQYVLSWMGIEFAGLLHVPVNTAYKDEFLSYVIEHSGSKALVLEPAFLKSLLSVRRALSRLSAVVFTSRELPEEAVDFGGPTLLGWREFVELGERSDAALPDVGPSDISAIRYTSGTTGRSKGVLTPHLSDLVMADEYCSALGITSKDVLYTSLPLFHGAAQMYGVMAALNAGATIALGRRFSATEFWDEIRRYEATSAILLGSLLMMLLAKPESSEDRNHLCRTAFAAPASQQALFRFEKRFGVKLIEGYGQTETKTVLFNTVHERRPGSIGKPTPTSIVSIVDEHDHEMPAGRVGEIVYRPTQPDLICRGYWNNAEATVEAMRNLWWHTGDLGYRDNDGYFYFVDRRQDVLRRRGENISSRDVEDVLLSHPAIEDAAAVAVSSSVAEDELLAVIRLKEGGSLELSELFHLCDTKLPYFMVPRYFRLAAELPYTPNGKIRKSALRAEGITKDTWDSQGDGLKPTKPTL
jgi:crotonobetaine/carnitine-CoA ligase